MAVPLLGYYDIFKNFYANTQEENFYTIGATDAINKIIVVQTAGGKHESNTPDKINIGIANGDTVLIYPINTYEANELTVTWIDAATETPKVGKPTEFGTWNKTTGRWAVKMPETTVGVLMSIIPNNRVKLRSYPLEEIEEMRDQILQTKGNTTYTIKKTNDTPDLYKGFTNRLPSKKLNTTSSQYGLAIKTYNSDLLQNWINTEWIEGVSGINEISAAYRDW